MHFHFCLANHDHVGRNTLYDMFNWFEAGLVELGHKVTIDDNTLVPTAINLLWEKFFPDVGNKLRKTQVIYGIIATEVPDGNGFNWRKDGEWEGRWHGFPEAAYGAAFIWTLVEQTVPFYSKFAPTTFVELGFSELLIPQLTTSQPDIDFSFFGLRTPHREKIITKLRKYAAVEWPEKLLTADEVNNLISRTKIGLSFKQSENWPVPSPTRLGRLLMAKRGAVVERTAVITRQGQLVSVAPQNVDFVDFALTRLQENWRETAERAFQRYRVEMPMFAIMENVLKQSLTQISLKQLNKAASVKPIKIDLTGPLLLDSIDGLNIIIYNGKYYAIHQSCGEINFILGEEVLKKSYKKKLLVADSFNEIKEKISNLKKISFVDNYLKSKFQNNPFYLKLKNKIKYFVNL